MGFNSGFKWLKETHLSRMQIVSIYIVKRSQNQTPHVHCRRTRLKSASRNVISPACCSWTWPCRRKTNTSLNFLTCLLPALFTCSFFLILVWLRLLSCLLLFSLYPTVCLLFLAYSSSFFFFIFFHSPSFFSFPPHFPYVLFPLLLRVGTHL